MESPSSSELPRITKRELERVGIRLRFEDNTRAWMRRGWVELALYMWQHDVFEEYMRRQEEEE